MLLDQLSHQEVAILFATRSSDRMQTAQSLANNAKVSVNRAQSTIALLVAKKILYPVEQWDSSIGYGFPDNEYAQSVYDEIYGPLV